MSDWIEFNGPFTATKETYPARKAAPRPDLAVEYEAEFGTYDPFDPPGQQDSPEFLRYKQWWANHPRILEWKAAEAEAEKAHAAAHTQGFTNRGLNKIGVEFQCLDAGGYTRTILIGTNQDMSPAKDTQVLRYRDTRDSLGFRVEDKESEDAWTPFNRPFRIQENYPPLKKELFEWLDTDFCKSIGAPLPNHDINWMTWLSKRTIENQIEHGVSLCGIRQVDSGTQIEYKDAEGNLQRFFVGMARNYRGVPDDTLVIRYRHFKQAGS